VPVFEARLQSSPAPKISFLLRLRREARLKRSRRVSGMFSSVLLVDTVAINLPGSLDA